MKEFMDKDFLLKTETAKKLYHDYAAKMPVLDYHCHISPKEIWEDRQYKNITEAWLEGDHYKWRAIRSNGVAEDKITADCDPKEKFRHFAEVMEKGIGNPLVHWAHLELQRYFGFTEFLTTKNADEVYDKCSAKLQEKGMSVRGIIEQSGVTLICSTDDPIDSLEYHKKISDDKSFKTQVLPAFRPDKIVGIDLNGFTDYIEKLSVASKIEIKDYFTLLDAVVSRIDSFDEMGCKASDHSLGEAIFAPCTTAEADVILKKALAGKIVTKEEADMYKTAVLTFMGREYAKRNWVMQLHMGPIRNTNEKMFERLGADHGFDCMGPTLDTRVLGKFLSELDKDDLLPKTVLYSLNPCDNAPLGALIGAFQNDDAVGKVQQGSAWWFNDSIVGMREQMTRLASLSMLGNFIGMLTDSRSFLSYTRHEYFRRILCDLIGDWVENGEYVCDYEILGKMVQDISYNNAVNYFGFNI